VSYPPQNQPPPQRRSRVAGGLIAALAVASVAVVLITGLAAPGWMLTDAGESQGDAPAPEETTTETTTERPTADPQAVGITETFVAALNSRDQAAAEAQICELNRYLHPDEVATLIEQGQHLSAGPVRRSDRDPNDADATLLVTGSEESVGGIGLTSHNGPWCIDNVVADY
jgi:hypothetical protein